MSYDSAVETMEYAREIAGKLTDKDNAEPVGNTISVAQLKKLVFLASVEAQNEFVMSGGFVCSTCGEMKPPEQMQKCTIEADKVDPITGDEQESRICTACCVNGILKQSAGS
jgi:hypothetical protein